MKWEDLRQEGRDGKGYSRQGLASLRGGGWRGCNLDMMEGLGFTYMRIGSSDQSL